MRFRILGPLEVFDRSGWIGIRPARCRALLAMLLLGRHEVLSVDRLVSQLWGETPPKTAATQVHGYIMRLRRALDDPDGRVLVTTSAGYRIERGMNETDAEVFESHADAGYQALRDGRLDEAFEELRRALDTWRGPALSDIPPTRLVTAEIHRLTEKRLAAWEARVEIDLERGRHEMLVGELRRHVEEHPLREQGWRQLMIALYRCGRPAEALQTYHRLSRTLAAELDVEPSSALRELNQQLFAERDRVGPEPEPPAVAADPADLATAAVGGPVSRRRQMRDLVDARVALSTQSDWSSLRQRLRADPALRYSDLGRKLLHCLDVNALSADEWSAIIRSVPAHWSSSLTVLADRFAIQWRAFADVLRRLQDSASDTAPASSEDPDPRASPERWTRVRNVGLRTRDV